MTTRHLYTITVSQADIDNGHRESATQCMVARAINHKDAFTAPAHVFRDRAEIGDVDVRWPRWIQQRIKAFDNFDDVAPFSFGLLVDCDAAGRVLAATVDSWWERLKMIAHGYIPFPARQTTKAAVTDHGCGDLLPSRITAADLDYIKRCFTIGVPTPAERNALATMPRPQPQPAALPQPLTVEIEDGGAWIDVTKLYGAKVVK